MSTNDHQAEDGLLVSPGTEPSLPCIIDGNVAIQIERHASIREESPGTSLDDKTADSGVIIEDLISPSTSQNLSRQPITEESLHQAIVNKDLLPGPKLSRKTSADYDVSSQESCSPLHSPRDNTGEASDSMSTFYSFLHSKGLGDCCQYFPAEMTLQNFSRLTEYELINLYDIQSSHIREVVMHTIQNLEKVDEDDDEVASLHKRRSLTISSCTSTPPRSPSPRKSHESPEIPSLMSRRLLHRTFSEDVKSRRRRESMPHSHSSHTLNSLSYNSISQSCGSGSDFSNLVKIRNSLLGHSAPNLTSSLKDLSLSRRSSGRSMTTTPKKISLVRCVSPQTSLSSPIDMKTPNPLTPQPVQHLKKLPSSESRRWSFASYASSGYSTTTAGSNASLASSMERMNPFFAGHELLSEPSGERFSSSESNPALDEEMALLSPLPRPRSRSFSPTRAMPLDADSTFMMNSVYRERFPKAVQQMEEKLRQFVTEHSSIPQSDEGDGALRFVHKQIVNLAQDCLDKCQTQLLSALYFHELSENLRTLSLDVKSKANTSFASIEKMIKSLLMIISRTARLLECLEFDPDEFYCLLEQAEGQAKKTINTADIPKYIISKLCLNRDPLEAILPEDLEESPRESLDTTIEDIDANSSDSKFRMTAPVEEDFDYIKQISNGAYGVVWLVRNKYNNQRFAMKKLLKTNLVLRNQVEQVFNERDILIFADNPFVVSLYGSFETKKHLCLVMEYVEGGDCAALLKHMGPLPVDMARVYFAETVLALEYIHDYGIVHRDLKPDNLLITNEGHIKLTDFGLSKMGIMNLTTNLVEGILDRESKQFNDRQIFGTPEYIAPEVILREGYGKPVDWWSMGVILYEFLVGCVPFYGDTPEELFQMVLSGEVEFPEEEEYALPPEAQDLILRLLERDPLKRLGTTGARHVMEHLFVSDIDWDSLLRQKAEFIPDLENEEDTSYFDLRADRFPQHNDYDEDSDEDIMINSFNSCSPRYTKVYQKVHEMKCQQEHESLSRQSSDSSSVFGAATHISSDSGSESPRVIMANDKAHSEDFSFDKTNMASTPEFRKSNLKSNTSTPKRAHKHHESGHSVNKEDTLPSDISDVISRRSASRSVSFDSEVSRDRDSISSQLVVTPRESPLATPTSPSSPSGVHKLLRRTDALSPTATDNIKRKDDPDDAFDAPDNVSASSTPDSVFPSAPSTPVIQYDVLPPTSSYTPVTQTGSMTQLTVVTTAPSVTLSLSGAKPRHPLSLSLPTDAQFATSSITPILPISFSPACQPPEPPKQQLQVTSSSDSASSSSANNSPGSIINNKQQRKARPISASRLQRSKHPGNMLLAKVTEKFKRPRSRTSPDVNLMEEFGDRAHSLPEVSVSASSPSPPSHKAELSLASGSVTIEPLPRRSVHSPRLTLSARGATNSCPVPVPSVSSTNKSMFVKSASATQLSLLIPPPTEDFGTPLANVLLSPTSSASSRDQSPTRDALRRPPYILKKGSRGYGFFLKVIRVYSGDAHFYHLNHLITNVAEGSPAYQAGLRPNFLVTHINNEPTHGLPQPQIVRLIQRNPNMVSLRALPIEDTALKPGSKPPSELRKAKLVSRKATVKKKQSFSKVDRKRQRSSSLLKTSLRKRNAETHQHQTTLDNPYSFIRIKTPRSPRLPADIGLAHSFSSASSSPMSSGPNSPANSFSSNRPGSLQGLSKSLQCIKSPNRRKSVHNIPLSPLARTPSPSPMAISPTSQNPPSKLAIVAVKSGPSPSTRVYKHSPRLGKETSLTNITHVKSRSRHNSVNKTESTQSDPGKASTVAKPPDT